MLIAPYESRFKGFHDLIQHRVREILLVSTLYDAYVLEEDHNLSERLFSEYVQLDLRFVPRITRVSTGQEALSRLAIKPFDLVLCMTRLPDMGALEFRAAVKKKRSSLPVMFLTYDALDTQLRESLQQASSGLDRVFYWFRDTNVLTSIVKHVEDSWNAPSDTRAGVQVILLVEDSPRYYSLFLPLIYTEILTQTQRLISEGVNDFHRLQRMRARPKILLAETLNQARRILRLYRRNIIGIISDVRFPAGGELDARAGLQLAEEVRGMLRDVPVLLQSSELENRRLAHQADLGFLFKGSDNLGGELRAFIQENFGFGDFVFRYPDRREVARARNLHELHQAVSWVPDESLLFHAERNHFSIWLRARTEFALAEELRPKRVGDYSAQQVREIILNCLASVTTPARDGAVHDFAPDRLQADNNFHKLGTGSMGGKARGLAFMHALLARSQLVERFGNMPVGIPNTFVLCTDVFERFVADNSLRDWALAQDDDEVIAARFQQAQLPKGIRNDLRSLLSSASYPLAVRSSSLLEDNQTLPFAGIYSTYMLPNNHPDPDVRQRQVCNAIKRIYASIFFRGPREYIKNTGYRIDEERMAVVIQQIVGRSHGDIHYPTISGVARSYNYYPFADLKPEDGTASLALGLGKTIVDSERVFHFCPNHPHLNPPFASAQEFLENTQARFFALDIGNSDVRIATEEEFSLRRLPIERAERDGTLQAIASTWFPGEQLIRDHMMTPGPRVVRFAQILKYETLPLPEVVQELLEVGEASFGSPVEIEFAVDVDPRDMYRGSFNFLQIRPMQVDEHVSDLSRSALSADDLICSSIQARDTSSRKTGFWKPTMASTFSSCWIFRRTTSAMAFCMPNPKSSFWK